MEQRLPYGTAYLVRCLECGTIYTQPDEPDDAAPCPNCDYVGWIALGAGESKSDSGS
jgi:hypothetical protein